MYESIGENEWYFFTSREKYPNGSRSNRSISGTGDDKDVGGFWKASGADVKIYSHGKLVGYKKVLVFHEGKPKNRADVKKTNWIMYEFRVADEYIIPTIRAPGDTKLDDCILCMIYENSKRHDANNQQLDHSQNHQDTVMIPNTNQARYIGFENLQQQLPNLPCNDIQWNDHMTYFGVDGMNLQLESSYSQPSEAEISSNPFV